MSLSTRRGLVILGAAMFGVGLGCVMIKMPVSKTLILQIGYSVVVPIAVLMILVPRIERTYHLASWAKLALWIVCCAMVLWCVGGFLQVHFGLRILASQARGFLISQTWVFISGFIVGMSMALFLSGAVSRGRDEGG